MKMGAKSAPKPQSGGRKRPRTNQSRKSVEATTQISEKKAMVAESAIKMEKWWRKMLPNKQNDLKGATTFKSGGTLATISVIVVVH